VQNYVAKIGPARAAGSARRNAIATYVIGEQKKRQNMSAMRTRSIVDTRATSHSSVVKGPGAVDF
jgi:hypothetical protein